MKKKIISFMLSLVLLSTLVIPSTVAYATADDDGMEISKTATANTDGSYTITLEAYATGEKIITEVTEYVPTDIILVLDQSGSMKDAFDTVTSGSYSKRDNSNMENYPYRQNGGSDNIWYKLSDGSFVRVSMRIRQDTENIEWKSCITHHPGFGDDGYVLWNGDMVGWSENGVLYQLLDDGTYARCYVTGNILRGYTYTYADGTSEYVRTGTNPTKVDKSKFFYVSSPVTNIYDYFYVDADGKEVAIETSKGDNTKPKETYYSLTTTSKDRTKLQALKDAVSQFSESVKAKAAATGVNHRIAVVGFASGNTWNGQNYNYNNTEVFVGANQYTYGSAAQGVYSTAFMDMNDPNDAANVTASIGALAADGGTLTNLGVEMANGIFKANPIPSGEKRNRVVVVFTDGQPGWSGYDSNTANAAITQAATTKSTYGATVYTVGIFEGANVNGTDNTNTFMRNLSSGAGYYLTASNSAALNNIFQQISNNIESGGTTATLGSSSVVKDIIAPSFQLPAEATANDITLETYSYTGEGEWTKNPDAMGATATIIDGQVSVTGFDFSENWCGTVTENENKTYRGNKLKISFKVVPKPGFLGGNDVPTNGDKSGVYADASADTPIMAFDVPTVNVPIATPEFEVNNKTIYEGNSTAVSGLYTLTDYTGDNAWKAAYVEIKTANTITGDTVAPTDCTNYDVTVTYKPYTDGSKSQASGGAANAMAGESTSKTATVHVLHPVVTAAVNDVEEYYGESYTLGNDAGGSITLDWVDGHANHTNNPAVEGTAPYTKDALHLEYATTQFAGQSGTVPKNNFDVIVKVKKGTEEVTGATITTTCGISGSNCATPATDGVYTVHVKTCQLTINKTGGAAGEPYVFTVYKDNTKYSEVSIVGNSTATIVELPVGSYTIAEDAGWSWRYSGNNGSAAVLSADSPSGNITCTNSLYKEYWLNGFSTVVANIFGTPKN